MKLIISALFTFFMCNICFAKNPCTNLAESSDKLQSHQLKENISNQLRREMNVEVKNLEIMNFFKENNWSIIYAETQVSDEPLLIYNDDVLTSNYIALFSGAVSTQDEDNIKQWITDNTPGIPYKLEECFLWFAKYRGE
jgi:hypothetical protein